MWDTNMQVHKYHLQDVERAFARATNGTPTQSGSGHRATAGAIRILTSAGLRGSVAVAATVVLAGFLFGL